METLIVKSVKGRELIEFIQFNFDGKGNALIRRDGDIEMLEVADLYDVLFGANGKEKEYIEVMDSK
jgi:hypothetical protein